jgi:hypothetical protein
MKVLVGELGPRRWYITNQIYQLMSGLVERFGWLHVETARLRGASGSFRQKIINAAGEVPDAVLFLEEYNLITAHLKGMTGLDFRTCFFADDLHRWMEARQAAFSACDMVVTPNAHVFFEMYPALASRKRVAWLPNSAGDEFMIPYNERPEDAIFLSGAVNHFYPLRAKVLELYERQACPIAYFPHPGYGRAYDHTRDEQVGRGYARKINQYRAGFTDSSTLKYLIAKYFEIPATGALLLADDAVSEPFASLGFVEYEHYIPISADTLEEKIAYVLDRRNREEIDRIRRAGQELVWAKHKISDRIKSLDLICSGVDLEGNKKKKNTD